MRTRDRALLSGALFVAPRPPPAQFAHDPPNAGSNDNTNPRRIDDDTCVYPRSR